MKHLIFSCLVFWAFGAESKDVAPKELFLDGEVCLNYFTDKVVSTEEELYKFNCTFSKVNNHFEIRDGEWRSSCTWICRDKENARFSLKMTFDARLKKETNTFADYVLKRMHLGRMFSIR